LTDDLALIELETRLAYQEDAIKSLEDLAYRQQRRIEALEMHCRRLSTRLGELLATPPGPSSAPPSEPPPHY
jgi:SlyX protein